MTPEDELLSRHLSGDLSAAEQGDFLRQLKDSPELRRKLARQAFDEILLGEVVREGKVAPAVPRRRIGAAALAAAGAMIAVLGLLLFLGRSQPGAPAKSAEVQRIDDAVIRAARYLESRRSDLFIPLADGKRHTAPPRRLYADLVALALLRAGYKESHPLVEECLGRALSRPLESTYVAAIQAKLGKPEICRRVAQFLADSQCENGQWDYGRSTTILGPPPSGLIHSRGQGPSSGDNSVSSYAVQGLLSCHRAGVDVDPQILERARRWWLQCQNPDGGWGYAGGAPEMSETSDNTSLSSYGSASASGISSLAALRELLGSDPASDQAIVRGKAWLGSHFAVETNPQKSAGFSHVHWLLAAERAGTLLGEPRFGAHDWFGEGSAFLLSKQEADGAWRLESGKFMAMEKNDVVDTALAILFLLRD